MLKHLLASSAILTLSLSPAIALSGPQTNAQNMTPVPNPDGYNASQINRLPAPAMGPGATLGGQLIIAHVANNAALALALPNLGRVRRDGFASAGDGGAADYTYSSSACSVADGGSCINSSVASGSWVIDWKTINFEADPRTFGATFKPAAQQVAADQTNDTNAFNAALATGRPVRYSFNGGGVPTANSSGGSFSPTGSLNIATRGQSVRCTDGRARCTIFVASQYGPGVFNVTATEVTLDGVSVNFSQPDTSSISNIVHYQAAVYAENQPALTLKNGRWTNCWICFDMSNGNSGNSRIENNEISGYSNLTVIDGAVDVIRDHANHRFPLNMTTNQVNLMETYATGLYIGRLDGLLISDDMFITAVDINMFKGTVSSAPGCAFVAVSGSEFDGHTTLTSTCGSLAMSSSAMTVGNSLPIMTIGGSSTVMVTGSTVGIGGGNPDNSPAFVVNGQGSLTMTGTEIDDIGNDSTVEFFHFAGTAVSATSYARLTLSGNSFYRNPGLSYSAPEVNDQGGGVLTAIGNVSNYTGVTSNVCFYIPSGSDMAANRVIGNACPNGVNTVPTSPASPSSYNFN